MIECSTRGPLPGDYAYNTGNAGVKSIIDMAYQLEDGDAAYSDVEDLVS